jgi:hypothetical protein
VQGENGCYGNEARRKEPVDCTSVKVKCRLKANLPR